MASVRRHQKLPLCPTETVRIGFNVDPLLAKAEPTRDVGSTSMTTYLRKGKSAAQLGGRCEKM